MITRKCSKNIALHILLVVVLMFSILLAGNRAVDKAYAASPSEIKKGDHVFIGKKNVSGFTGHPYWRVLDKNSSGDLFLLSEYLWTGNDLDDFIQFNPAFNQNWQGSNAQAWCKKFEKSVIGNIEGLTIKETTKSDENCYADDAGVSFYAVENILDNDRVFFLSAEEVKKYMPLKDSRTAFRYDGKNNFYITEKESDSWWLRSPRMEAPKHCVGEVVGEGVARKGFITNRTVDYKLPARPAMWVHIDAGTAAYKNAKGDWFISDEAKAEEAKEKDAAEAKAKAEAKARAEAAAEAKKIAAGTKHIVGGATYKVISPKSLTVRLINAKNVKNYTVPATVKIRNKKFKVVQLDAKAFTGSKIRKVTVGANVKVIKKNAFAKSKATTVVLRTKLLKKAKVKGCFKSSKVKTVQVKVGSKAQNKKTLKTYKKFFTKSVLGRKVSIK